MHKYQIRKKKKHYRPKSNANAAHIIITQLTVLNDFVTKHTLKLAPCSSARVHWKILLSEKLKIYSNVISQVFLKTVYFPPQDLWNDGASAYVSYTNLQAPKIEIKTGSKADAWYAIITNLLLKVLKNSPSHSNFRLQASKFNLVN